jgi:hypothetical protein
MMLCNWLSACVTDFEVFDIVFLATLNYKIAHFMSPAPLSLSRHIGVL